MAQHNFSDSVLGLVQSGAGDRAKTLLKAATELYVAEARHSRVELAMFEELAMQLLPSTSLEDRAAIARMLASYDGAPPAIIRALLQDTDAGVSRIILSRCPHLTDVDLLGLIATGSEAHLGALAARTHLGEQVIEALAARLPLDLIPGLVGNLSIRLPGKVLEQFRAAAKADPRIAVALSRRYDDVEDTDLVDHFLDLDTKGRRRVIQALEILALRDFAARRAMPRTPTPAPEIVADMTRAALSRYDHIVADKLALLLNVDVGIAERLLDDMGGEPLAVALKAAGLDGPTATRMILFSGSTDTRNYFEVKRLVDLYENVSLRSALLMLSRWRGDSADTGRGAGHVPQTETGTPVRRPAVQAPQSRPGDGQQIRRDIA